MSPGVPLHRTGTSGSISEFYLNGTFNQVLTATAFPADAVTGVTNFSPSQLAFRWRIALAQDIINVAYDQTITANGGTGPSPYR